MLTGPTRTSEFGADTLIPLIRILLVVFAIGCSANAFAAPVRRRSAPFKGLRPTHLRCDEEENPLGIDNPAPRLYWSLESGTTRTSDGTATAADRNRRQTAYRILVASSPEILKTGHGDLWDSGKVKAGRLPYAVYAGKPLGSRQRVCWKVRVWDENDVESDYSQDARFEMGLLHKGDWQARWISGDRQEPATDRERFAVNPAPLFRKEFRIEKPVASARAYICGLGYYELRLNGEKTGDRVLDPGWTNYAKRDLYVTYDMTHQLRSGANAIGAMLGSGWYDPLPLRFWGHINLREHLPIGKPRLLLQLEIAYRDGSQETISTDGSWKWQDGPIRKNSVYLGETYDADYEIPGWDKPGLSDADWRPVRTAQSPGGELRAQSAPPIRVKEVFRPVKYTEVSPGVYIADMGRNYAGWVRLHVRGAASEPIRLRYGELLHPDGTLNPMTSVAGQIKGAAVEPGSEAPSTAWQTDSYHPRNGSTDSVYTPRFTFHGFRYVEITGLPARPVADTLEGLILHSDVADAGEFACSNPLLNDIQAMTRRTELSNLFSVQSDCPHREKFGYGGDIVATSEMAMLNFDMSRFYAKTVRDHAEAARPDGGLTETAPFVGIADAGMGGESGPVEWGTAHPLLLWQLYRYYGNRQLVQEQYGVARRWVDLLGKSTPNCILDNGIGDHESLVRTPRALSGTAFYYANVALMAKLAAILGKRQDAARYSALAEKIRAAFQAQFDPRGTGTFADGSQGSQAFALYYGLVPDGVRQKAIDVLAADVLEKSGGHLNTGIFGTKYLLNALTDGGRADVAGAIATQTTFPGWGHMLANGATTLWEHWEFSDNVFSHNHPMFGSISEWFYKALAGIAPADDAVGFDRVVIHPRAVSGATWARGRYNSVRGPIATAWERKDGRFMLDVTIPVGMTATVFVPARDPADVTEGGKPVKQSVGVRFLHAADGEACFEIGSGTYRFVSRTLDSR